MPGDAARVAPPFRSAASGGNKPARRPEHAARALSPPASITADAAPTGAPTPDGSAASSYHRAMPLAPGLYEHPLTEALAEALDLDMRKWWTATAASYFEHVSKARVLAVVTEAAGANAASPLAAGRLLRIPVPASIVVAGPLVAGIRWPLLVAAG